jgi:hypothetical protein
MRVFEVVFFFALAGTMVWLGWFASGNGSSASIPVVVAVAVIVGSGGWKRRSRLSRSR